MNDCAALKLLLFDRPFFLEINLTERCNLHCVYCRANSGGKKRLNVDPQLLTQALEESYEFGVARITISGGEPTLYSNFDYAIELLSIFQNRWALLTNGTVITRIIAKKLREAGVRNVQISVAGLDPATDTEHRGIRESLQRSVRGLRYLADEGVHTTLGFNVTSANVHQVDQLSRFCESVCVDEIKLNLFMAYGRGALHEELRLNHQQIDMIKTSILHQKGQLPPIHLYHSPNHVCPAGYFSAVIGANGKVYACSLVKYSDFVAGDLRKNTLLEVWRKSAEFELLRKEGPMYNACHYCPGGECI